MIDADRTDGKLITDTNRLNAAVSGAMRDYVTDRVTIDLEKGGPLLERNGLKYCRHVELETGEDTEPLVPSALAVVQAEEVPFYLLAYGLRSGRVSVRARVRDPNGELLAEPDVTLVGRTAASARDLAWLRAILTPPDLAPGVYTLELRVADRDERGASSSLRVRLP